MIPGRRIQVVTACPFAKATAEIYHISGKPGKSGPSTPPSQVIYADWEASRAGVPAGPQVPGPPRQSLSSPQKPGVKIGAAAVGGQGLNGEVLGPDLHGNSGVFRISHQGQPHQSAFPVNQP